MLTRYEGVMAVAVALRFAACDPPPNNNSCGVPADCHRVGDKSCTRDGRSVRICDHGLLTGCLEYFSTVACGMDEACVDSAVGCAPRSCSDTCPQYAAYRCSGDLPQRCLLGADGCFHWVTQADCTTLGRACVVASGVAACDNACQDNCPSEGEARCALTVIETCARGADGCLDWVAGTDCNATGLRCAASPDPTCVCAHLCDEPGATRCNGTSVETCGTGANGCRAWVGAACADPTPRCAEAGGAAACVGNGAGERCDDPRVVVPPAVVAGADYTADFDDDFTVSGAGCTTFPVTGVDAVFAVDLAAGKSLVVTDQRHVYPSIFFQSTCDPAGACLSSGSMGARYTAPSAGRVYVLVEFSAASAGSRAYELAFDLGTAENCTNHIDDDLDLRVDCDDPDCFSAACGPENRCDDHLDNDGDGHTDCDDADCQGVPGCKPLAALYEFFAGGAAVPADPPDPIDLAGHTVTFTPDDAAPEGYRQRVVAGVTDFPVAPGSGTRSTLLTLSDNDSVEYVLGPLESFEFFGIAYGSIFVGTNGYVTFGARDTSSIYGSDLASFFLRPRVALLDADASVGTGEVTVDEFAERVVVTYNGLHFASGGVSAALQIALAADGSIALSYVRIDPGVVGVAGITSGVGILPWPSETDFTAASP